MNQIYTGRIISIDILRGIVMVIMALDHTRDFFHITAMTADPLDPATTTPALFFTRWITHFCAPVFLLLSGISAYLSARNKTPSAAGNFLVRRGFWLILMEVVVITLGLTFNPFYNLIILQVIWAIGWSMVLLGLISRWSFRAVVVIGLIIFFGHNLLDGVELPTTGPGAVVWQALLTSRGMVLPLTQQHFVGIFYTILPWSAIMFLGYGMGAWFLKEYPAAERKRNLLLSGAALIMLFLGLRFLNQYGDPQPFKTYGTGLQNLLSFLNTSKYPPSLQFAGMTLGPALLVLAALEPARGRWVNLFTVYGRVPFFYFVAHFYLLHFLLVIVFFASGYGPGQINDPDSIFLFRPVKFGFALPVIYFIWLSVVAFLYRPCVWFQNYRLQHQHWWLRYL